MAKPYFDDHVFDLSAAEQELAAFKSLLDTNTRLAERKQVLANFDTWPNLCAMFGFYHGRIQFADRIKREFRISSFFRTDLTVRRSGTDSICVVEFEGASNKDIFEPSDRGIDTWARPFEKGFSQVVDRAWALDTYRTNPDFMDAFGSSRPNVVGVLVIGRSTSLPSRVAKDRWDWRRNKVNVDGMKVSLITFDELHEDFNVMLTMKKTGLAP
ncbi:Shedu anti-phage system protein SduA domain-containing protein [Methylobacterium sp. EM32]|uniref:Shedu anti-phage system protein SduA domain-containing protein n=1 Tax=Methylobacterium sp. EM32 TaxID=3163481 RepID=UPI0033AFBFB4